MPCLQDELLHAWYRCVQHLAQALHGQCCCACAAASCCKVALALCIALQLRCPEKYDISSDMWSLGVIMYIL